MREDWESVNFEDCLERVVYPAKIKRKDFLEKGEFPIVSQEQEFINGYWNDPKDVLIVDIPVVVFGDHTKTLKYVDFSFVVGADGVKVLKPKSGLNPKYLYYYLQAIDLRDLGYARHYRLLREQKVSYPKSLPEQQRIVSVLDKAIASIDEAIANTEQNLKNAKELFDTYLFSLLSNSRWEIKLLSEICTRVEYGTSSKSKQSGKVPVLRMGNIQDGRFDYADLVYSDDDEEIDKYTLRQNDVLFNRTNSPELVGKTAIYKSEMPAIFAGYLIRIHRKEELLDGDFLTFYLNSERAKEYGRSVVISSVNQANINGTKLKSYPIPCPSLIEQKEIVGKLQGLREEISILSDQYENKIVNLKMLKKSILHCAFNGELYSINGPIS